MCIDTNVLLLDAYILLANHEDAYILLSIIRTLLTLMCVHGVQLCHIFPSYMVVSYCQLVWWTHRNFEVGM